MGIVGRSMACLANSTRRSPKKILTYVILAAVVCALAALLASETATIDYIQYWAGAKIFVGHGNPFDVAQIRAVEAEVWGNQPLPILLWNTPLIFPFIAPLAAFDYHLGRLLWLFFQVGCAVAGLRCVYLMWRAIGKQGALRQKPVFFFLVTFYPGLLSLHDGQVSPLLLAGFCGYLYWAYGPKPRPFIAGLLLSITLLKPHLLYLVYLHALFVAWQTKSVRALAGLVVGALVLGTLPLLYHAQIWSYYTEVMRNPPLYWQTPTLGSYLQGLVGQPIAWVRALPALLIGLCAAFVMARCKQSSIHTLLYTLVPLSLLSSPYGWVFDQMLLLPTAAYVACELKGRWRLWCMVCLNFLMLCFPAHFGQQAFIWYSAGFLLLVVRLPNRQDLRHRLLCKES